MSTPERSRQRWLRPRMPQRRMHRRAQRLFDMLGTRTPRWLLAAALVSAAGCSAWPMAAPPTASLVWRAQTAPRPREPDARSTPRAEGLLLQARLARSQGRLADARRLARAAQQAAPHDPQSYELEAQIALDQSDIAGYLDALQRLLDTQRADAAIQNAAGRLLVESGQTTRGLAALQRATRLAPGKPAYWQDLAAAFVARGEIAKARAVLRKGLQQTPSSARLWLAYARLSEAAGDQSGAADAYARAARLAPQRRGEYLERANLCRYRAGLSTASHSLAGDAAPITVQPASSAPAAVTLSDDRPAARQKSLIGATALPGAPPRVLRFDLTETTVAPVPAPPAANEAEPVPADRNDAAPPSASGAANSRDIAPPPSDDMTPRAQDGMDAANAPPTALPPGGDREAGTPPQALDASRAEAPSGDAAVTPRLRDRTGVSTGADALDAAADDSAADGSAAHGAAARDAGGRDTGHDGPLAGALDSSFASEANATPTSEQAAGATARAVARDADAAPATCRSSAGELDESGSDALPEPDGTGRLGTVGSADRGPSSESFAGSVPASETTAAMREREMRIAALIDQADAAMQAGRYGLALQMLDEVARLRKWRLPELALLRAACAVRSGNVWKARQILASATARWPEDPRIPELQAWIASHFAADR